MPKISYFAFYLQSTTAGTAYSLGNLVDLIPGWTTLYGIALLQVRGDRSHDIDCSVMVIDYVAEPFVNYVARLSQSYVWVQYSIIWK